jgi:hypothetical protein
VYYMKQPKQIGLKPTVEDFKILSALIKKLGGSTTSVLRMALRVLAAKEGVSA